MGLPDVADMANRLLQGDAEAEVAIVLETVRHENPGEVDLATGETTDAKQYFVEALSRAFGHELQEVLDRTARDAGSAGSRYTVDDVLGSYYEQLTRVDKRYKGRPGYDDLWNECLPLRGGLRQEVRHFFVVWTRPEFDGALPSLDEMAHALRTSDPSAERELVLGCVRAVRDLEEKTACVLVAEGHLVPAREYFVEALLAAWGTEFNEVVQRARAKRCSKPSSNSRWSASGKC